MMVVTIMMAEYDGGVHHWMPECPVWPFVYLRQSYLLLQHWCEVEHILVPFY